MDSIAVMGTKNESFALYLPISFDSTKALPILFVFDPAARGKAGLLPFIEASERHNIILVCSNNSKNGSFDISFSVADHLFNHVFHNFKVDTDLMFLSGFSGGSRLASAIAVLSGQFAGVIGCGAGFSPNPMHTPSGLSKDFLYAAICGTEDMNYSELLRNTQYLEKIKFTNTLFSFNGGHRWPDQREITRAFDWLFIKKNKIQQTQGLTHGAFSSDYDLTQAFLKNDELLFAQENYERMLGTYPQYLGLDSIQKKSAELVSSKPFKAALQERDGALIQEEKIKKRLFSRLHRDLDAENEIRFKWWENEAKKLHQIEKEGSKEAKRMVARIKYGIVAAVYEKGYSKPKLRANKDFHNQLIRSFRDILYPNP